MVQPHLHLALDSSFQDLEWGADNCLVHLPFPVATLDGEVRVLLVVEEGTAKWSVWM